MRINKFFTDQGYCSRREADRLIQAGRVKVNGRLAVLGDQVELSDEVELDGKRILFNPKKVYLMYHKPVGITCTTDPNIRGNIIEAIKYPTRIFPIGRLDKDSTGLIFMTNDGDIVNRILRAQFGHEKEYLVRVNKRFNPIFLDNMASGVDIGDHLTLPCKITAVNDTSFNIILTEGKNRQIRRMCDALGYKVVGLHRFRIMNINIGNLKVGELREFSEKEFSDLKDLLDQSKNLKQTADGRLVESADVEE